VNNAGANWAAPLADYPDSGWDKVMNLNVKGIFHLTRLLVPLLEKAASAGDPARVLNVGSVDGLRVPGLEIYAYAASKAAIHHLTRVLARRLAPKITVNAIAPGPFESKMMAETLERFRDSIIARIPMGRIGEPDDMAGIAIFLASRAGAWMTGTVIPMDGGETTNS
jgi:NAD(P)-dependent dehydrogenase (short-subunit alcohol dehydrogenase family)